MTTESTAAGSHDHGEIALPGRRVADWYELFFDLVFVVVIAISAEVLEKDTSFAAVLIFLLLLFPLWWAWVNLMVTNNLFGARYGSMGVLVIAAMPGPAAMAIAISTGIGHSAWLFAVGAAWIRLVLLAMWLVPLSRGGSSSPLWRPFVYNLGTAALWLASIAVPQPWQYLIWAVAVGAEVLLLAVRSRFSYEIYERASVSHALERVGLFVVIVIGEAVYLAVTGLAAHLSLGGAAAALAGLLVCALLARAFFRWGLPSTESGLERAQKAGSFGAMRDVVMYFPYFLVAALTLLATAIGIAVKRADAPLPFSACVLLATSIALVYLTNAAMGLRLRRSVRGIAMLVIPGVALPTLACLLSAGLAAWATLTCAAVALGLLDVMTHLLGHRAHSRGALHDSNPRSEQSKA
ncbi:MAG: low temperature requirement protein A [Lacisediminihabitans sp.]